MEKILILGNGGHARSLADVIEREKKYEIAGYVVNTSSSSFPKNDYEVIGSDTDLKNLYSQGIRSAAIGIGFLGKGNLRQHLYERLKAMGYNLPIICDPSAVIASNVVIGEGTFIGKGAILNTGVRVGRMCILNTGAIIEHDCTIGDFSHVAVRGVLCGSVIVGTSSFIGANATVIQERRIGNNCIVGAGEIVKENIRNGEVICRR